VQIDFWNKGKNEKARAFLAEQSPVIIMGRGHSGTRVLAWACTYLGLKLGTNEGLATGDADDVNFTRTIRKIATNNVGVTNVADLRNRDINSCLNAVYGYYQRLSPKEQIWGWKFPETYLIGAYIEKIFPKARYLHLVRDGRDIAFKNHITDNPKRKLGKKILSLKKAEQFPHHLQAAASWAIQVDLFEQFAQTISADKIFYLRFEDLCMKPLEVVGRLCDFLNLPLTNQCEKYLTENINTKKVSQYRENDPDLVKEVEKEIAPQLEKYQYL